MTKKTLPAGATELDETDLETIPTSGGLKVTFPDLLISSYQTGGSSGDVVPTEQLSLNYEKIR